jgi:hypothetical protein
MSAGNRRSNKSEVAIYGSLLVARSLLLRAGTQCRGTGRGRDGLPQAAGSTTASAGYSGQVGGSSWNHAGRNLLQVTW